MKGQKTFELYAIFSLICAILIKYSPAYNAFMLVKIMSFVITTAVFMFLFIRYQPFNYRVLSLLIPLWFSFLLSSVLSEEYYLNVLIFFGFVTALLFLANIASRLSKSQTEKIFLFLILISFVSVSISLYQRYVLHRVNPFLSSSTVGNQNFFGGVLAMIVPIYLYFIIDKRKLVYIPPLVLTILVLIQMQSRGAGIALTIGLLAYVILHKRLRKYLVFFIVLLIIVMFSFSRSRDAIRLTISGLKFGSTGFRFIGWQSTINIYMYEKRPFFGKGVQTFEIYFPKYRRKDIAQSLTFTQNPVYAHNDYLQLLVENGLFGFAAFVFVIFAMIRMVVKHPNEKTRVVAISSAFAMLSHSFVSFPLYRPSSSIIFWFMVGITMNDFSISSTKTLQVKIDKALVIALLIFFSIISLLYTMRFQSSIFFNLSYHSIDRNHSAAAKEAWKATRIWPGHYKAYNFLGMATKRIYEKNGYKNRALISKAIAGFRQVTKLRRFHSYYNFNLGQAYVFRGIRDNNAYSRARDLNNAIHFLSHAIQLDPNAVSYYNELALAYKEKGKYKKAIRILKEYIKLGAVNENPYVNLGNIYFNEGNMKEAIKWYSEGLKKFPNSPGLLYSIGGSYYWLKDYNNAIKYWKSYLKRAKDENIERFIKKYESKIQ